jgi:hypothetical protein
MDPAFIALGLLVGTLRRVLGLVLLYAGGRLAVAGA